LKTSTAWAIGLQTSAREPDSTPLALERRLLLSYLVGFVAIFLTAAVVVRFAFVSIIEKQTTTRLQDVARAGIRSVLFDDDGIKIDKTEISNAALLTRDQGLQWFRRDGRLLASEGVAPPIEALRFQKQRPSDVGPRSFRFATTAILNPRTHQRLGAVRASEWTERELLDVRYLDTGLTIGTLLAILGSGAGGLALTRRAVRPVARSFQTLHEFTADAAHELRGPLTVIANSADAALREAGRDPAHDRFRFEAIADSAKRMSRLTNDLLLLAGADRSLERELFAVDLAAMVNELAERYRTRFSEAGIALNCAVEGVAVVYGNPAQIERILSNLLENALRYTAAEGRVSIESRREGAAILVTVRDSGVGIAPEHLKRIFDRFWRADAARSSGGSGLGLAIARALARRHGGDLTVTSRYGLGSTFVLSLPVRPARIS
jgi:two-component system, OmpR family, manganese sensing sensor histidine kinase